MGGKFPDTAFVHKSSFLHHPATTETRITGKTPFSFAFNILLTLVNFLSDYLSLQELSVLLI